MISLHQRAKAVFLEALERPAAERAAFIAEACTGDEELRRELESLLPFHDAASEGAGPGPQDPEPEPFAAGQVIAGRYRMVTRIGRGGMGDVWRADDLILQMPVALKVIHAARPDARARILNEVRLARQITHPSVCRVFDVGEADGGVVFYTMELVTGEDLASLLKRVGRVPAEKVLDIARQLCAGLIAAHTRGVLHRDLKPANILIDDGGQVRITDFGIAISRVDADLHMLTGTPGYMAPEQRMRGGTLSERTDLYALGVVLYELLAGQHPFPRSGSGATPVLPSKLVSSVDPRLERVIMRSLSADPRERPASALAMADELTASATTRAPGLPMRLAAVPVPRARRWIYVAATAAIAAMIGGVAVWVLPRGAGTLTERDTIVLADFQNATDEPVFDGALKVALAVALEQSPFIKVFPDDRARDTLRLMRRSPEERMTPAVAREIARREQLKALLAGSIASLGRNYVLTIEAINAETGDVMAREQAEAGSKEEVLTALGAATSRLRQKLGESLASIQRFDVPLPRATTASIDALHAYALALPEGRQVPRLEAVPHLKRAVELDPSFALAHAQLSGVYTNTGQTALAPEYSRRAFELRDRVSERERFFISWRYYRDAVQDADRALELARTWTATYAREAFAFNALGAALIRIGRFEDALSPLREAIRLDAKFSPAYANLSASLFALGRYSDARAILQQAIDLGLDFNGVHRLSYLLAFVQGDEETMARELQASVGVSETNAAYGWRAHTLAFAGRTADAHDQFRQGIHLARQGDFGEVASQLAVEDAEVHAIVGQCAPARAEVAEGLAGSRDNETLERASRVLALCGATGEAQEVVRQLTRRFPQATLTNRVAIPVTNAILALNRGDAAHALEILEGVKLYDHAPSYGSWSRYLRGHAYLHMKDGRAAAVQFQEVLDTRGETPVSMLYALSHAGLAKAALLDNDVSAARRFYDQLFALWRDADAGVEPLREARVEYARLPAAGSPIAQTGGR